MREFVRCVLAHLSQHAGDDAMGWLYKECQLGEGPAPCQRCSCTGARPCWAADEDLCAPCARTRRGKAILVLLAARIWVICCLHA